MRFGVDTLALVLVLAAVTGCGRGPEQAASEETATATSLTRESIAVAERSRIEAGPRLSGTLEAERQASVRAEIGGTVLAVLVEEGQRVARGALLARIEDRAVRDAQLSARSAVRSAEQNFTTAERQAERTRRLVEGGALAERDLEVAVTNLASARAQLDDARARLASASEQVGRTQVSSPIAGIVSNAPVSTGDVVAPGTELFTVVDPASMRLVAAVPADALGSFAVGASVEFRVRGYPNRVFIGRVQRISPSADPVTRQIPIYVSLPNTRGELVAGLFADGSVAAQSRETLVVPSGAVAAAASGATVLRVRNGIVEEVPVQVGIVDERSQRTEILNGLAAGDTVLVGAARVTTPGTRVSIAPLETQPR